MLAPTLVFAFLAVGLLQADEDLCPRKHHALIVAFLPLHRGNGCQNLSQRGVQQKVALDAAVDVVNAGSDLQIGLKVLDTCTDTMTARDAGYRGLTFAEKRCSRYPVFLGFLGPDDDGCVASVRAVPGLTMYPHIVPAAVRTLLQYTFSVEMIDPEERAQSIAKFLRHMRWHAFVLIYTDDTVSVRIATSLFEQDDFCLTNTVLRVPSLATNRKDWQALNKLRRAVEEVQDVRIVVIADDPDVVDYFFDHAEDKWSEFRYIIYVQGSGILPWRLSQKMLRTTVILHEISASPLALPNFLETLTNSTEWKKYASQVGVESVDNVVVDPTIVPYVHAVHLLSRSLKTATWRMCRSDMGATLICDRLRGMSPSDWESEYEDAVSVGSDGAGIRFFTVLKRRVDVIVGSDDDFIVAGSIEGEELSLRRPDTLRPSGRSRTKQCLADMYDYEIEQSREDEAVVAVTSTSTTTTTESFYERRTPINFGYHELMATVIGFPIVLVFIIALTVICVWRSYRRERGKPGDDFS